MLRSDKYGLNYCNLVRYYLWTQEANYVHFCLCEWKFLHELLISFYKEQCLTALATNQLESSYKILRWGGGGGGWGGKSRKSFLWVQVAYHNRKVSFLASTPHSGGNSPTPHPWIHPCSKYHLSGGFNPLSSSVKIQNLLTGIHAFTYGTN